jgi:hypothetical protein
VQAQPAAKTSVRRAKRRSALPPSLAARRSHRT